MADNKEKVDHSCKSRFDDICSIVTPAKVAGVDATSGRGGSDMQIESELDSTMSKISQSFEEYGLLQARELQNRSDFQISFTVKHLLGYREPKFDMCELASFNEKLRDFASSFSASCEEHAKKSDLLLEEVKKERERMAIDFCKWEEKTSRDYKAFGEEVAEIEKAMMLRVKAFREHVASLEAENGRLKRKIVEQEREQCAVNQQHTLETKRLKREVDTVNASRRRESEMAHEEIRRLKTLCGEEIDEEETQLY